MIQVQLIEVVSQFYIISITRYKLLQIKANIDIEI